MTCFKVWIVAIITLPAVAGLATAQNGVVSVTDFGALTNGTNAPLTTAAFQQAFAAASPSGKVTVPAGYYAINNPAGGFVIPGFSGEVKFDGDAQVMFQSNSQSGFVFSGGWGPRVEGAHLVYQYPPVGDTPGTATLEFNGTVNARVSDIIVESSPGYAIWFVNALEPKLLSATVINSFDDGIRFENSRNSQVTSATVTGSGQNGLNFFTAPGVQDRNGATAANIIVNSSQHGIAVSGTSRVTLNSFYVESSWGSGIYCGSGVSGALSDAVTFQSGVIANAGGFGAEIGPVTGCSLSNLQVVNPASIGVSVNSPGGNVALRNVRVTDNRVGDAFNVGNTGEILISDCSAENSPGYGFFFDTLTRAVATGLTTLNVASLNPLHRAVWFQNVGSLTASNITLADSQSTPTGFVVGTNNIGHGSLQNIASNIVFGGLSVQNSVGVALAQVN
jgi:hypothetical protein